MMKLFPVTALLKFGAIDISGQLLKTPCGSAFLMVITDRYFKLLCTAQLKNITAATIAQTLSRIGYIPPVLTIGCCRVSTNSLPGGSSSKCV